MRIKKNAPQLLSRNTTTDERVGMDRRDFLKSSAAVAMSNAAVSLGTFNSCEALGTLSASVGFLGSVPQPSLAADMSQNSRVSKLGFAYNPDAQYPVSVTEVPFRKNVAGRQLMARIYRPVLPPEMSNYFTPAILDLHGGAWNAKDRLAEEPMDRSIAASGILVVAIDLTLAGEAPYPANVQDANYGVRWLKKNAHLWGASPHRLGVYGSSSGGHVAELLGMRPKDQRYNAFPLLDNSENWDASVAYIATRSPISNPFARYQNAFALKREKMMQNHTTYFKPWESIHESNPQEILDRGEDVGLLPLLIMQGELDDNMLPSIQEKFASTYNRLGGSCEYRVFSNSEHEWVAKEGVQTTEARKCVKAFIAKQLI